MDEPGPGDVFRSEGFRFGRAGGCLYCVNGSDVSEFMPLGSRALVLLPHLLERQGKLVSKHEIMKAVWRGGAVEEANLTVQISALRRALDRDREQGSCIQTISGRGYPFASAVTWEAMPPAPGNEDSTWPTFARPEKPSIAVLPFANLSDDPKQEYFADGMEWNASASRRWKSPCRRKRIEERSAGGVVPPSPALVPLKAIPGEVGPAPSLPPALTAYTAPHTGRRGRR